MLERHLVLTTTEFDALELVLELHLIERVQAVVVTVVVVVATIIRLFVVSRCVAAAALSATVVRLPCLGSSSSSKHSRLSISI